MSESPVNRREFLRASAAAGAAGLFASPLQLSGGTTVALAARSDDGLAAAPQVQWALRELQQALERRGVRVQRVDGHDGTADALCTVTVAGGATQRAIDELGGAGVSLPESPESVGIVPRSAGRQPSVLATGRDARGLMYAVLELADRVDHADDWLPAVLGRAPVVERPHNSIRAIGRPFVSDVEDKPWFDDREFWPGYFAMLARQRINRFHFSLGLGYDTLRDVTDAYLLFAYPFLTAVPGYDVRAVGLPDAERDRNLETLRFISREAAAHGIDFQLGLWTHGYVWEESPRANYTISGLTPKTQAAYSRDALTAVLKACPGISGVTLRTHYESGVREGSYPFWRTIFDGVPAAGRPVEIELHAKGLDQRMIDGALACGVPVRVSAKYWAEHTGLPYHQTTIRELERPHDDPNADPFAALSFGSRNHTRYGYADFLRDDRRYGVMFRVFPGSHKFLLWGDPLTAAAHARAFRFCGSEGAELLEPLAFKGRRGSGIPGGRCAYVDRTLEPSRDWEKFRYTYLLWGRLLYNPDAPAETWRRQLRTDYREAAPAVEAALGAATRILPIVATAHLPSAAHDTYSPEFYTNQSMADAKAPSPYGDTPTPKVFGTVSPLDPEMFSTIEECADALLGGAASAKHTPLEVAQWLDDLAQRAAAAITDADRLAAGKGGVTLRRAGLDVRMQAGMGRFFAAKFRGGVAFVIHQRTGDRRALEEAIASYRQARTTWAAFAESARSVYAADITFGPLAHQRGHWADRVAAMDADIALLEQRLAGLGRGASSAAASAAVAGALDHEHRQQPPCSHTRPDGFVRGQSVRLALEARDPAVLASVELRYRHVNQAERYQSAATRDVAGRFEGVIPAEYTKADYPLQYYFVLKGKGGGAWIYPGFPADLDAPPYVVLEARA
jgi:hypothetical protein